MLNAIPAAEPMGPITLNPLIPPAAAPASPAASPIPSPGLILMFLVEQF